MIALLLAGDGDSNQSLSAGFGYIATQINDSTPASDVSVAAGAEHFDARLAPLTDQFRELLAKQQQPDGSISSHPAENAVTLIGLQLGSTFADQESAIKGWLLTTENPDGGWGEQGSSAAVTSIIAFALAHSDNQGAGESAAASATPVPTATPGTPPPTPLNQTAHEPARTPGNAVLSISAVVVVAALLYNRRPGS
jgi:hypothetical protein